MAITLLELPLEILENIMQHENVDLCSCAVTCKALHAAARKVTQRNATLDPHNFDEFESMLMAMDPQERTERLRAIRRLELVSKSGKSFVSSHIPRITALVPQMRLTAVLVEDFTFHRDWTPKLIAAIPTENLRHLGLNLRGGLRPWLDLAVRSCSTLQSLAFVDREWAGNGLGETQSEIEVAFPALVKLNYTVRPGRPSVTTPMMSRILAEAHNFRMLDGSGGRYETLLALLKKCRASLNILTLDEELGKELFEDATTDIACICPNITTLRYQGPVNATNIPQIGLYFPKLQRLETGKVDNMALALLIEGLTGKSYLPNLLHLNIETILPKTPLCFQATQLLASVFETTCKDRGIKLHVVPFYIED